MSASKRCMVAILMAAAATILPTASPARVGAPNEAGDLDPIFGGDGKVTTNVGSDEELRAVAVDSGGDIVAAGCRGGHDPNSLALVRYRSDGTLDPGFGGDGKVTTSLSRRGGDCAIDVAIQPDGKIVAAGSSGFGVHGKFGVVRYEPDGTLDPTFGGDGRVATDFTPDSDWAGAVAIQADGKIVAAGQSGVFGTNTMFAVVRYNPDGTRDTTFGEHGRVTTDFTPGDDGANAVGLQSNGKIVVAGGAGTDRDFGGTGFALARYEADGTLDTSFGEDGLVTTAITVGKGDAAADVESLSNGKILAAGVDGTGGCRPCGSDMSTSFALVQYNADGTIDTGFGGSGEGLVITPLSPKDDAASELAVQSDGRIVVAGSSGQRSRGGGDSRFALVRYKADGSRDQTFGGDGKVTTNLSPGSDFANGMAIQPNGKIVAAGIADYLGTHDRFALARYFSDAASQPGSDLTQVRLLPETTTQRLEGGTDTPRRAGQSLPPPTGRASPGNGRIVFQRVFWAPDGSAVKIAMFTVKPDGTGIRQLTHPPRGVETGRADWSPDGRWITYMRTGLAEPRRPRIFVMRRNGADRTDLTKGHCRPSSCQGENDPAWSPNGKRIAFVRSAGDTPSIFVMSAAGRQRRQVTTPPSGRFTDSAPAWSPDGKRLVFVRLDQKREAAALFIVRLDSANVRRITPWRLDDLNHPDWSSNGRWIVFQKPSRSGETHVCLIHPNGAGLRNVTHTPHFAWSWAGFSPDGRMITAVRVPGEESENDIYVVKLDGTGVQSVTGTFSRRQSEGLPDWGPLRSTRRSDASVVD